jgi:hypothetical protein
MIHVWEKQFWTVLDIADCVLKDGNKSLNFTKGGVFSLVLWVGAELEEVLNQCWFANEGRYPTSHAEGLHSLIEQGFVLESFPEWTGPQLMAAYAVYKINEAEQAIDDLPPKDGEDYANSREDIFLECASCVFEAMEACHLGRQLIGKDITPNPEILAQLLKKQNVDRAKKAAAKSHESHQSRAQAIIDWYLQNHARYKSLDNAAEAAQKHYSGSFRTIRKHIGAAAKQLRSA